MVMFRVDYLPGYACTMCVVVCQCGHVWLMSVNNWLCLRVTKHDWIPNVYLFSSFRFDIWDRSRSLFKIISINDVFAVMRQTQMRHAFCAFVGRVISLYCCVTFLAKATLRLSSARVGENPESLNKEKRSSSDSLGCTYAQLFLNSSALIFAILRTRERVYCRRPTGDKLLYLRHLNRIRCGTMIDTVAIGRLLLCSWIRACERWSTGDRRQMAWWRTWLWPWACYCKYTIWSRNTTFIIVIRIWVWTLLSLLLSGFG